MAARHSADDPPLSRHARCGARGAARPAHPAGTAAGLRARRVC
ncbi:hypothetical protein ACFOPN_17540 [Xanthomonas hyacinthi]